MVSPFDQGVFHYLTYGHQNPEVTHTKNLRPIAKSRKVIWQIRTMIAMRTISWLQCTFRPTINRWKRSNRSLSQSRFIGGLLAKLNPFLVLNVAQIKTGIDGTSQSSRIVGESDNRSVLIDDDSGYSQAAAFHQIPDLCTE